MTRWQVALAGAFMIFAARGSAADPPDPVRQAQLEREVRDLRAKLAVHFEDLDLHLQLAYHLAWTNHYEDAKAEAKGVLDHSPQYSEAYVLLAQIAAWTHDFAGARAWLDALEARQPLDEPQLILRSDTYLWEGRPAEARRVLDAIHPAGFDLELLLHKAAVASAELDIGRAHELAREILEHSPNDLQAQEIFGATRRLLVGIETYVGRIPFDKPEMRLAAGAMATLVIFPLSRFSATAQYEYDYRFATNNSRLALRGDWRPTLDLTITAYARAGWVSVVPVATFYGGVRWAPRPGSYLGSRYVFDAMAWPGQLHRLTVEAGHDLPHQLHADASVAVGLLDYCGSWQAIYGFDVGLSYVQRHWQLGVKYARYSELDRPPLPSFLEGMFGPNVCPSELGPNAMLLDLSSVQANDAALIYTLQLDRRDTLSASYTYERLGVLNVHTLGLAIRRSF